MLEPGEREIGEPDCLRRGVTRGAEHFPPRRIAIPQPELWKVSGRGGEREKDRLELFLRLLGGLFPPVERYLLRLLTGNAVEFERAVQVVDGEMDRAVVVEGMLVFVAGQRILAWATPERDSDVRVGKLLLHTEPFRAHPFQEHAELVVDGGTLGAETSGHGVFLLVTGKRRQSRDVSRREV